MFACLLAWVKRFGVRGHEDESDAEDWDWDRALCRGIILIVRWPYLSATRCMEAWLDGCRMVELEKNMVLNGKNGVLDLDQKLRSAYTLMEVGHRDACSRGRARLGDDQ